MTSNYFIGIPCGEGGWGVFCKGGFFARGVFCKGDFFAKGGFLQEGLLQGSLYGFCEGWFFARGGFL
jgi:hypothetical protein